MRTDKPTLIEPQTDAKILLLDIETSPNLGWVWGKYQQDIINFNKEWFILCFSVKWLDQSKIITKCLPDYSGYKKEPENDKALIEELWKFLDEADIVIAHNGDEFDIKKINSRIVFHGMLPPSPFKSVDTLKMARRYFGFNSNRLEDLADSFSLPIRKLQKVGGFGLWLKCIAGDSESWAAMAKYNRRDVELLEQIYYRLRAWDVYHPLQGAYNKKPVCSRCGSSKVQSRGLYIAKTLTYRRFWCVDCGGWMRAGTREKTVNKPLISV